MNDHDSLSEIDRLLMTLVDGELSRDQEQRLFALLRDDSTARARYADYLLLDSHLAWEHAWDADAACGEDRVESIRKFGRARQMSAATGPRGEDFRRQSWGGPLSRIAAAASLAGVLTAFVVAGVVWWPRSVQPEAAAAAAVGLERWDDQAGESQAGGVAILTRAVDVVWEAGSPAPVVGSTVGQGVLRVRSGVLQLEFYCGATLVSEGPAEIELKAIDHIACRSGKLRVQVPPSARGFRVDSPAVDLVDLGTEFGMRVLPGRKSEVHVFNGKVELHETDPPAGRPAKWELSEGHGVRFSVAGDVTPLVSDSPAFLAIPDIERLYLKESNLRYKEWAANSRSSNGDPRRLVFFSFEDDRHPGSRILVNQCGERSRDGSIVGCEWVNGRWPGKGALEFKRPSDRVRFKVPGDFESLTFAAWVRIDAIERRFSALMLTDGFEVGELHWQIDWLGEIVLGIRNQAERPEPGWYKNYTSPRIFTPERFGRWTHVTTVYDHTTQRVTHYVDGVAVGSEAIDQRRVLRIGDAELGNWGVPTAADNWPVRNLCGRMDEFSLFRTALGPDEVRALYEQGSP